MPAVYFYAVYFLMLKRPITVLKNLHALAIRRYAHNGHIRASEHKIDVEHRIVYAQLAALLVGVLFVIFEAVIKSPAEREMADRKSTRLNSSHR